MAFHHRLVHHDSRSKGVDGRDVREGGNGAQQHANQYVVTPVDEVRELSAEEDAGLEQALSSLRAGEGIGLEDPRNRIAPKLKR